MLEPGAPGISNQVVALWSVWGLWNWRGWQGGLKVDSPAVSPPTYALLLTGHKSCSLAFNKTSNLGAWAPLWLQVFGQPGSSQVPHLHGHIPTGPTDILQQSGTSSQAQGNTLVYLTSYTPHTHKDPHVKSVEDSRARHKSLETFQTNSQTLGWPRPREACL